MVFMTQAQIYVFEKYSRCVMSELNAEKNRVCFPRKVPGTRYTVEISIVPTMTRSFMSVDSLYYFCVFIPGTRYLVPGTGSTGTLYLVPGTGTKVYVSLC